MTDAAQQEAPRRRKSVSCHNLWCGGSKLCIHCDPPAITEAPARSGGEVTSHASGAVEAAFAQGYDDGYEDCAAGHDKDHSLSWAAHKEALAALTSEPKAEGEAVSFRCTRCGRLAQSDCAEGRCAPQPLQGGEVTREAVEVIIALVERFERVDAPKADRDLFRRAINARSGLLALISPAHREAQPKAGGGGEAVTCQSCGGEIQGWTCQGCGAIFRENDAGVLVRATPEGSTEGAAEIVRRWANWIIDESSDMECDDHDAGKRKVRRERDLILADLSTSKGGEG